MMEKKRFEYTCSTCTKTVVYEATMKVFSDKASCGHCIKKWAKGMGKPEESLRYDSLDNWVKKKGWN